MNFIETRKRGKYSAAPINAFEEKSYDLMEGDSHDMCRNHEKTWQDSLPSVISKLLNEQADAYTGIC